MLGDLRLGSDHFALSVDVDSEQIGKYVCKKKMVSPKKDRNSKALPAIKKAIWTGKMNASKQ